MAKRKLSKDAIAALKQARDEDNWSSVEWIALDAFRVWYKIPYWDENGSAGIDIGFKEFVVKEVK